MRVKTGKSVSKLLGIWTFLLLLIIKGAFPKAAYACLDSGSACIAQPACAAVLTPAVSSEVATAVSAPTAAGLGASTLSTTTASGTTLTFVKAVAGIAVVG